MATTCREAKETAAALLEGKRQPWEDQRRDSTAVLADPNPNPRLTNFMYTHTLFSCQWSTNDLPIILAFSPLYIEKETERNREREKVQMIRRLAAQNYNEVLLWVRDLDRISFGLYLLQSYFISKVLRIMLQDLLFLTIIIRINFFRKISRLYDFRKVLKWQFYSIVCTISGYFLGMS